MSIRRRQWVLTLIIGVVAALTILVPKILAAPSYTIQDSGAPYEFTGPGTIQSNDVNKYIVLSATMPNDTPDFSAGDIIKVLVTSRAFVKAGSGEYIQSGATANDVFTSTSSNPADAVEYGVALENGEFWDDTCPDKIINVADPLDPANDPTGGTLQVRLPSTPDGSGSCDDWVIETTIAISNVAAGIDPADPGGGDEEDLIPSCETEGGSLSWIACPVLEAGLNALEIFANFIGDLLFTRPIVADSADPIFNVWAGLRNVALALLVVASLIAVFGQALSLNIMDQYTVKRMVPRIGAAAIGITMSFYIAAVLIDVFNILGQGMYSLILSAAGGLDISISSSSNVAAALAAGLAAGGFIVAGLSQGFLVVLGLLLLPVLLAFLTAIFVIMARQIVIIMMVLLSPIAFAAWLLPNTQKWFNRWWGLLTTMLMMYPLIMLLLASGTLFAILITNGAWSGLSGDSGALNESNFFNFILAMVAIGVTLFMIPFTLRASSGILSNITGRLNDPNRGIFDRARKGLKSAGDYSRGKRKEDRLAKLQNNAASIKDGRGRTLSKTRVGWYRLATGTGPGGGGRYSDEKRAELQRQAMTSDDRILNYQQEAIDRAKKLAEFKVKVEIDGADFGSQVAKLTTIAKDTGRDDQERLAAYGMLAKYKREGEMHDVLDSTSSGGDTKLAQRMINETFSDANLVAPHLARAKVSAAGVSPDYSALKTMRPEDFARNVTKETIVRAAGADPSLLADIVSHLAAARPETRESGVVSVVKELAAAGTVTSSPGNTTTVIPPNIVASMPPSVRRQAGRL